MADFKCINCGEIKDSKKACSCPTCGYKMFELPYERRQVLVEEIRSFIKNHELLTLTHDAIAHYRLKPSKKTIADGEDDFKIVPKSKDDERFPNFNQIRDYVCSADKTERFIERLNTSISNIRKHIHKPYQQEYKTNLDTIKTLLEKYDGKLKDIFELFGVKIELELPEMPEIDLDYREVPDKELLIIAVEILNELSRLSEKIHKFIKQNNLYGSAYRQETKLTFHPSSEKDYAEDLRRCLLEVSEVNNKTFIVSLLSDGSEELGEMLKLLWNSLSAILLLPVLKKESTYTFADGTTATYDDICSQIIDKLGARYTEIDSIIDSESFLSVYDEESVVGFYDKLIQMDSFDFLGIKKDSLLKIGEAENKLNDLIGLTSIKESIQKIKAYALSNKDSDTLNIHMCYYGNPGTGKTEVARIVAEILFENKILPTKKVIEVDRSGLVSQYFGATAQKTQWVIQEAMGGVLFVDEAYALANNSDTMGLTDYGKEALDTLVKAMEDYRGKFCVIFAGYRNEMQKMISVNPGLRSRIQFELDFPNFFRHELEKIAAGMLLNHKYSITDTAMSRILDVTDVKRKDPQFANAREIRNIIDQVIMCQNLRSMGTEDREIGIVDVNRYIKDAKISLPTSGTGSHKKILTGDEEMEQLIGLAVIKRMIRKIKAYAKRNQGVDGFNLHMCFYGNPGTGKTEVARILSRILYDAGVLDESKLVETDSHGLIGKFVGETASKTIAKVNDAMNGVLFIDEAYGLVESDHTSYGGEAIAVLLKEMEDRRGQFCVILAGYKNEMNSMLQSNPGLQSRIQFSLDFPDYSREELGEIAVSFLRKKHYEIDHAGLERILDLTEYYRDRPNFANARTVRNILDQVIMNHNLRTEDFDHDNLILVDDVEDYISDEGIDLTDSIQKQIGFV